MSAMLPGKPLTTTHDHRTTRLLTSTHAVASRKRVEHLGLKRRAEPTLHVVEPSVAFILLHTEGKPGTAHIHQPETMGISSLCSPSKLQAGRWEKEQAQTTFSGSSSLIKIFGISAKTEDTSAWQGQRTVSRPQCAIGTRTIAGAPVPLCSKHSHDKKCSFEDPVAAPIPVRAKPDIQGVIEGKGGMCVW